MAKPPSKNTDPRKNNWAESESVARKVTVSPVSAMTGSMHASNAVGAVGFCFQWLSVM